MRNRILASGVIVAGIVMLFSMLQANLFGIAPEFEDLTDGFRPIMEDEALATAQADVQALEAVGTEFQTAVLPQMSQALGMDEATFGAFMGEQFPAVAAGVEALPAVSQQFNGFLGLLEDQQANFGRADDIPTTFWPATTMPWIILFIGGGMVITGAWMFFRARSGNVAVAAFGILVLLGAGVLAFVPKANAADDMNSALEPVYTQELVDGAAASVAVVGAMGQEMQQVMLPAIAQQLQLSDAELAGFLSQFPATAAALESLPEAVGRFTVLARTFDEQLTNYQAVQVESLTPVAWTVMVTGAVTLVLGLVGLFTYEAPVPARTGTKRELTSVGS